MLKSARQIPSDNPLLSEIREGREGSETAARELRVRHGSFVLTAVRSVLRRGCDQPSEHEREVNAEAWITIFDKLYQLSDLNRFDGWRDEIARNAARAHLKKCIPTQNIFVHPKAEGPVVSEGSVGNLVENLESADLSNEFDEMLAGMQAEKSRKGMKAAFNASPIQLGRAAMKGARRKK